MKINIKKTKVMRVSKSGEGRVSIMLEEERLNKFGISKPRSTLSDDGKCDMEIKIRIALSKEAFSKRKE